MPQNYRNIVYWPAALDAFCVRLIRHSLPLNYPLICGGIFAAICQYSGK